MISNYNRRHVQEDAVVVCKKVIANGNLGTIITVERGFDPTLCPYMSQQGLQSFLLMLDIGIVLRTLGIETVTQAFGPLPCLQQGRISCIVQSTGEHAFLFRHPIPPRYMGLLL